MSRMFLDEFDWKNAIKLGAGYYGDVFKVQSLLDTKKWFAIKELKEQPSSTIWQREYRVYVALKDVKGIIQLRGRIFHDPTSSIPSHLVYDYIPETPVNELYQSFSIDDVRFYMHKLLRIVSRMHRKGIIHGDMKPHNVLIAQGNKHVTLVDLGHAQFECEAKMSPRAVGTIGYNAPELLLGWKDYGLAIDMWACGNILADMLMPFCFHALHSNKVSSQLLILSRLFGSELMKKLADKLDRQMLPMNEYRAWSQPQNWWIFWSQQAHQLVSSSTTKDDILKRLKTHFTDDATDLLGGLMCLDPAKRLNVSQALAHSFFYPLRQKKKLH